MTDMEKKEKDIKENEETKEVQDEYTCSNCTCGKDEEAPAAQDAAQEGEVIELSEEQIKELLEKAEKMQEYHDLLLRTRAEFDNFRKRTQRETAMVAKLANESLLTQILPVADNLERALLSAVAHENDAQTSEDMKSFIQGVRLTQKQLLDVMSRSGLERIETARGAVFNPRFHEAMAMVETDEVEDGCIVDEFQAGYTMGDRTVRAAAVRIAKAPVAAADAESAQKDETTADNA